MTLPVAHGYPDWGRTSARADKILTDFTDPDIDALETIGPFFVGDSPCLGIYMASQAGAFRFVVAFYGNSGASQLTSNHIFEMSAFGRIEITVPVMGPWVNFQITPAAVNSSYTLTTWLAPIPALPNSGSPVENIIYSTFATAFPVGTTVVNILDVRPGVGNLYVVLPAVASDVRLYARDSVGTLTFITNVVGNGIAADRRAFLPNTSLQIQIINAGGAPAAFTAVLSGQVGFIAQS